MQFCTSADTNGDDQGKDNASTAPVPATTHVGTNPLFSYAGPQPPLPAPAITSTATAAFATSVAQRTPY
jgi:hypothetical protein